MHPHLRATVGRFAAHFGADARCVGLHLKGSGGTGADDAYSDVDLELVVEELVDLIEHGGTGSSSGQDGRRTLSILLGILHSNAAGGTRVTFPIQDRWPPAPRYGPPGRIPRPETGR